MNKGAHNSIPEDTISRQAALVAVKDALMAWSYMPKWRDEKILEAIAELPSAQPEIIHCKDCGHRDDHGCCKYWKALAIGDIPIATDDNDFCSHAERRNDVFVER